MWMEKNILINVAAEDAVVVVGLPLNPLQSQPCLAGLRAVRRLEGGFCRLVVEAGERGGSKEPKGGWMTWNGCPDWSIPKVLNHAAPSGARHIRGGDVLLSTATFGAGGVIGLSYVGAVVVQGKVSTALSCWVWEGWYSSLFTIRGLVCRTLFGSSYILTYLLHVFMFVCSF